MRIDSIYKQLVFNIVLPVLLGLLILGVFSYRNTQHIVEQNNRTEKNFIYDEIKSFIELQFVALKIVEEPMEREMQEYSKFLVNEYFTNTNNIENVNLFDVREKLGMDPKEFDLYIINQDGIVVNTTFREDLYINFFSFGEMHRNYLQNVFANGNFDSPSSFFEHKTKRYKKYSYHPTLDRKYIIEIGLYSKQADQVYEYMINHLIEIPIKKPNLTAVDIFFQIDNPSPIDLKKEFIPEHQHIIPEIALGNTVTLPFINNENKEIEYTYFYIKNDNPKIINGSIVRIANDPTNERAFIKKERTKIISILIITLLLVYFLIYFRAKMIVQPIQHMIEKTKRIASGNYRERVNDEGNNEIAELSRYFNQMVNNIEERNNQIEEQADFLYRANRKVNEAYKLLDHQKSLIENKQDDLTASINYAHRIQESLLPDPDDFNDLFPEAFVYNLPRDIVSGDFYWFTKIKNKIVVVAADCTGHGVPGAFMSMIGMTILHHLVNYEHIFDPALILNRLDTEICDLLIYRNSNNQRFEGMDAAICCIDIDTDTLTFASAQRPIIIMRNGEAITYKGSIYPIGEHYDDIQKIFKNKEIALEENDIIYMFSDGYTSQFDEKSEKKFNYKRFRTLLTDIHQRPIKEHPVIIHRTFEAWKGDTDQIDDIMIIGYKYKDLKKDNRISANDVINDSENSI